MENKVDVEELKADLKALQEGAAKRDKYECIHMDTAIRLVQEKIAEALKPVPWADEKANVESLVQRGGPSVAAGLARYARHLEQRVAELEETNEKLGEDLLQWIDDPLGKMQQPKPDKLPKWGGKVDGKWVVDGFHKPLVFDSKEAAKYVFSEWVDIELYEDEEK